jgi:hypothetical protein
VLWGDDPEGAGALDVRWQAQPAPAGHEGVLLTHGPVTAWWPGSVAEFPARGCLTADLHGGAPSPMRLTTGTVTRVHVVTQTYRRTPSGTHVPVPGEFVLHQVSRSPKWFSSDLGGDPDREPPDVLRQESGVLVRLAVETPTG